VFYLSRMLGKPVVGADDEEIGRINDIAIETGEIFPRVTSLAFVGPDKKPFMLSWRKFVQDVDAERIRLNVSAKDIRFSYLQPQEVLLARDLLNKQIVDTQGKKVVLRGLAPWLETAAEKTLGVFGGRLPEKLIAWNYMELLERDLTRVKLSVTHKRLHELHPADVADILEQMSPGQRGRVFEHLELGQVAEAIAEMEDEYQAQVFDGMSAQRASDILEEMDPDDAADILGELDYERAERLLKLMGVREARLIRQLLGYREDSAGGIMTSEVTAVTEDMTVSEVISYLRHEAPTGEDVYYIYVVDEDRTLLGVINLRDLVVSEPDMLVGELVRRDVLTVDVEDDQEEVADVIRKYDLLAVPVVDEGGRILGVVTVDDALEVMEEESQEDLAIATGSHRRFSATGAWSWLLRRSGWLTVWAILGVGAALVIRAFAGELSSLVALVFFLPLVMRLSEDVASHSLAMLIESADPEERPTFGRQFAIDVGVGLGLGVVSGLVVLVLMELLAYETDVAVVLAVATAATVLITAVIASLLPWVALWAGLERRVPSTLISTTVALAGIAVYLGLATVLRTAAGV
jgi:magnesium transporter